MSYKARLPLTPHRSLGRMRQELAVPLTWSDTMSDK